MKKMTSKDDKNSITYLINARKFEIYDYFNSSGIVFINYKKTPKNNFIELRIDAYTRLKNIFTSWFGIGCDTEPISDEKMEYINGEIKKFTDMYNERKKELAKEAIYLK